MSRMRIVRSPPPPSATVTNVGRCLLAGHRPTAAHVRLVPRFARLLRIRCTAPVVWPARANAQVRIVELKATKQQYALKYINKRQCIKKDSVENVFRERIMMQELNHPYIINLRFAFQDDEYMFIGLDLALGGDVRFHILRQGGLTEQTVRIYAAEIALALGYIHSMNIIHRDLKPENLLIDGDGHVRITDFNVAYSTHKKFPSSRSGTLNYMAPEMFSGKRYTYAVDWWALGVVMFECFYGIKPFRGEDDRQVSHIIKNKDVDFPKDKGLRGSAKPDASPMLKDIIFRLLTKDPQNRIGGTSSTAFKDAIFQEEFFSGINWEMLYERKILPDFIPDMTKNNFEAAPALEELLYDSAPLTPKRRKKKLKDGLQQSSSVLSRDSLAASLNASLHVTSDGDKDMSKMTDKEKAKERERRQLQFIDDFFTVYVQGAGIGVLEKSALGALTKDEGTNFRSSEDGSPTRSASVSFTGAPGSGAAAYESGQTSSYGSPRAQSPFQAQGISPSPSMHQGYASSPQQGFTQPPPPPMPLQQSYVQYPIANSFIDAIAE
nr:hypothetical protein HK105_005349 [Polyrhizophydium stewartii]